jgi:hypothetical protein
MFCIIDSFFSHILKSFAQANKENTEIIKIAILQTIVTHDKIQFTTKTFVILAAKTNIKKTKFTNQI